MNKHASHILELLDRLAGVASDDRDTLELLEPIFEAWTESRERFEDVESGQLETFSERGRLEMLLRVGRVTRDASGEMAAVTTWAYKHGVLAGRRAVVLSENASKGRRER